MEQVDLGRLVMRVGVRALVVGDEWQRSDGAAAGDEAMHGHHATRVPTAGRGVDAHDHEQIHAREVVRASFQPAVYEPQDEPVWREARERFADLAPSLPRSEVEA